MPNVPPKATFCRVLGRAAVGMLVLMLFWFLAWWGYVPLAEERFTAANHYIEHGHRETGAPNIVTAVYLGYRAYDTLGEAIILILGVIGTVYILEKKERRHA